MNDCKDKKNRPTYMKYIKLWIVFVIIITTFYLLYLYTYGYTLDHEYMRRVTPAHPRFLRKFAPPLINFNDPPNLFNKNISTNKF